MASEKIYINGVFVREKTGQYEPFLNVSIDLKEFEAFAKQHGKNGQLRLNINRRRDASKTGVTHSVSLDTFEPGQRRSQPTTTRPTTTEQAPPPDDDVPF